MSCGSSGSGNCGSSAVMTKVVVIVVVVGRDRWRLLAQKKSRQRRGGL